MSNEADFLQKTIDKSSVIVYDITGLDEANLLSHSAG